MKNLFLILTLLGAASFTRALGAPLPLVDPQLSGRDLRIPLTVQDTNFKNFEGDEIK